jgi:hypothetical protein
MIDPSDAIKYVKEIQNLPNKDSFVYSDLLINNILIKT